MICKVSVFTLLMVCCTIGIKAQQCIPDPVEEVDLVNTTLTWGTSSNCPTTHYIVNIHSNGILEYVYQAENTTLNVAFLSLCRTYTFTVTAIADHIIGTATRFTATIALPADTNITVSNFTGNQIDTNVLLQWHINPDFVYCAETYRLLLWSDDSAEPEVILTNQNGYYIEGVAQCMTYEVELSVEYIGKQHPAAKFNYTVPAKPNSPSLVALRRDAITINTTWSLEKYSLNRCNVTSLNIVGTHINATIPIHDTPLRPTIDVSLPGLRADSMYFLNVTTLNEAGISRPFQVAVQTLPIDPGLKLDIEDSDSDQ